MGSIYISSAKEGPLRQGEILSNLVQAKLKDLNRPYKVKPLLHPYAIVISQDCDLDWDYNARFDTAKPHKQIPNILFCEIVTAQELKGNERNEINSKKWSNIKINQDERYHFFEAVQAGCDLLNEGLEELGADFKRYFTVPTEEVYLRLETGKLKRRCRLQSPYLEHFSTRFAYYQFRVALPEQHFSQPIIQ